MRHLRSILYTLVLAPAVWILCGVGFDQDLTGRARDNGGIESLSGVLLLLLAGAAYAILLFSPISPAGPLLAGLVLAGAGAWARIAPDSYAGVWPANVTKEGFDISTPGYGLAVLLAVPLLCVALSARRWRGYEPPEILLIGTIGRARVAGPPMASERTTVIPQQRQAPGFGGPSADATQVLPPQPRGGRPLDDGDEKTTVMRLGSPPAPVPVPVPVPTPAPARPVGGDEPTQIVRQNVEPVTVEQSTVDFGSSDGPTRDVVSSPVSPVSPVPASPAPVSPAPSVAPVSPVVSVSPVSPVSPVAFDEEETTGQVTGDETTRFVLSADEDEKTQLLTLPKADGGDQTEVVRNGTVEPPGDRTQVLTFRPPESPAAEDTKSMTIAGAERPNPGEDPTTRLTLPARSPGEATTRANPEPHPMTVTSQERPADEAADDTRPLTLPTPRPPAEEDTTRHL